jgi:hypothetical protein
LLQEYIESNFSEFSMPYQPTNPTNGKKKKKKANVNNEPLSQQEKDQAQALD